MPAVSKAQQKAARLICAFERLEIASTQRADCFFTIHPQTNSNCLQNVEWLIPSVRFDFFQSHQLAHLTAHQRFGAGRGR